MKLCAYCKQRKKLTREHVIPNWYINIDKSPDDTLYSERAPKKFISDLVVKDVCQDCNNFRLSQLDSYGKSLYDEYFHDHVFKNESIEFKYDFQSLLKWLIKCSYNSARVNNADLEVLEGYAEFLINEEDSPKDILVFCSLTSPSNIEVFDSPTIAKRTSTGELYEPHWFRLGVFRMKDFDTIDYCFRTVIVNSYTFYLALPKLGSKHLKQKQKLLSLLSRSESFGVRIMPKGIANLNPPQEDAISSFHYQIASNPITYDLAEDALAEHVKEETPEHIFYMIPRDDIENGNTEEIEAFFLYITSFREIALLYMQRLDFVVDGYNNDPRELYEIDEVRNYIGKLNKIFPYWLLFQNPKGKWLAVLFACLSKGSTDRVEGGKSFVKVDTKLIYRHINRWFISLNELSHRLTISERLNRKISEDFISRVKQFIPIDKKTIP